MFEVELTPNAKNGLNELKKNTPLAFNECVSLLKGLLKSNYGIPLENKWGMDYRNYYKIYCYNQTYRIIYTLESENKIKIVGIGLREDGAVYKDTYKKLD